MYAVAASNRIYHLVQNGRTLCGLRMDSMVFDHDGTLVPVRMVEEPPLTYSLCTSCDAEKEPNGKSHEEK
jgi:hypothetical protein